MGGFGMSIVQLKDICEFIVDCPHTTARDEGTGYPLVRTPNIGRGRLIYTGMHRVSLEIYNKRNARAIPQKDDLIFAREATAGNVALIQEGEKVCLGQRTVLLRPNKSYVSPAYLTYCLLAPKQQYNLLCTANGATVAHVNLPTIRNLKIDLPGISIQDKIATILSRYDSLIENYQKQIKLLEEAAQRLYKEWFIDLRFPGHENTKIADGLPEGWEVKSIIDVYNFKYGKILPTKDFVKDGAIPVYGASKQIGRYSKANCFEPKVLIGSRGNAGFVHRTIEDETYVTNNSFIVEPKKEFRYLRLPYIYESLKVMDFVAICTGAAQPQLTLNSIASLKYIISSDRIITDYCDVSVLFFKKIAMSYKQLHLLTEARDRLLPKLMSGEITI